MTLRIWSQQLGYYGVSFDLHWIRFEGMYLIRALTCTSDQCTQIVQDYTVEHDKICEAFASMVESLPRVKIYTNAFPGSSLLQTSVHDIFVGCLHFWLQACKFHRRKRLFKFLRATWNDYDTEFSRLERAMKNALDRVEKGGIAEHIKEAKIFRQEQQMLAEQASHLQTSKYFADMTKKTFPKHRKYGLLLARLQVH
jgi:hypothetical protein